MKRLPLLLLLTLPSLAPGQVVNFAKTLPERAFSVGLTPSYYFDNGNIGLRNIGVEADEGGALAIGLSGGYGLLYSLDLNARFTYVVDGVHYFGVDLQYLIYESRKSYFAVIGGLHHWAGFGGDLTGLFTYTPRYFMNFTAGIDLDIEYDETMESKVRSRVWLPVNVAFNFDDRIYLFAEYNLQVSEYSWGILSLGVNFIFR